MVSVGFLQWGSYKGGRKDIMDVSLLWLLSTSREEMMCGHFHSDVTGKALYHISLLFGGPILRLPEPWEDVSDGKVQN